MEDSLHPVIKVTLVVRNMFNEEHLNNDDSYLEDMGMLMELRNKATFLEEAKEW